MNKPNTAAKTDTAVKTKVGGEKVAKVEQTGKQVAPTDATTSKAKVSEDNLKVTLKKQPAETGKGVEQKGDKPQSTAPAPNKEAVAKAEQA